MIALRALIRNPACVLAREGWMGLRKAHIDGGVVVLRHHTAEAGLYVVEFASADDSICDGYNVDNMTEAEELFQEACELLTAGA